MFGEIDSVRARAITADGIRAGEGVFGGEMHRHSVGALARVRSFASAGLVAILGAGMLSPAARADDLPLPTPLSGLGSLPYPANWLLPNYRNMAAPYNWSGFYATPLIGYQTAQFQGNGGRLLKNAQGFTFGAEAGYNFQAGAFVFGPAAGLSYSLMHGTASTWLANVSKADIGWVGSARAKAGYTFDRIMIYATGGVAFGETSVDGLFASNSQTTPGWTAGGGVQYLWSDSAIFRAEYRRLELESKDFYALPILQTKVGVSMNVFNAGFYFKL
jgi:outer membrane immunogenic protein